MTQRSLLCICIILCTKFSAQKDSSRTKYSGFQIDLGTAVGYNYTPASQKELQRHISNDQLLQKDLSAYSKAEGSIFFGNYFQGIAGGKIFLKSKNKISNTEVFFGFRYGDALVANAYFTKIDLDTLSKFKDSQTQRTNYVIKKSVEAINYSVLGRRIFLPVGLQFGTDPKRLFWFGAGIEICPFLTIDNRFKSSRSIRSFDLIVAAGEETGYFGTNDISQTESHKQKLKGASTGIYFGFPLTVNFHPVRKSKSFIHCFNFFAALMPVYVTTDSKYSSRLSAFQYNVSTGLRVALQK